MSAELTFTCPHCAQPVQVPAEGAAVPVPCPACHQQVNLPAPAGALTSPSQPSSVQRCPFCLTEFNEGDPETSCPECRTRYHIECWTENGGCAVYGCSRVPVAEARRAIEIPVSYWGRENKPCPACGREILAAAMRCRHCGATFDSARPQEAAEFQERTHRGQRLPATRKTAICLFVCCVIPCLAPLGALWGLIWYPKHKDDVSALPSLYPALCKIGIGVAIAQSIALLVVAVLYSGLYRH